MNTGFFTVDTLKQMEVASDLSAAKEIAYAAVSAQPKARLTNTTKARAVIQQAGSIKQLMISCANFLLAHPSEGLGLSN
jgi:hypothetical protein